MCWDSCQICFKCFTECPKMFGDVGKGCSAILSKFLQWCSGPYQRVCRYVKQIIKMIWRLFRGRSDICNGNHRGQSDEQWFFKYERTFFVGFNVVSPCACACNVATLIQIQAFQRQGQAFLLLKAKHRTHILKRLPQSVQSQYMDEWMGVDGTRAWWVMSHDSWRMTHGLQ